MKDWHLFTIGTILVFALAFVHGASALTCETDAAPFLKASTAPVALCTVAAANNSECFTYLSDPANSSDVWGLPKRSEAANYGDVEHFKTQNNAVVVTFSRDRLRANQSVTGNVVCGGEAYSFNFTPEYIDYQGVTETAFTISENWAQILLGIILFIILAGGTLGVIYLARR
jgi:hypothetical protein